MKSILPHNPTNRFTKQIRGWWFLLRLSIEKDFFGEVSKRVYIHFKIVNWLQWTCLHQPHLTHEHTAGAWSFSGNFAKF